MNTKLRFLHAFGLFGGFFHDADVHERRFGEVVPFAFGDFAARADGFGEFDVGAGFAGEDFGDEEGLGEEAFEFAGAGDGEFVGFGLAEAADEAEAEAE